MFHAPRLALFVFVFCLCPLLGCRTAGPQLSYVDFLELDYSRDVDRREDMFAYLAAQEGSATGVWAHFLSKGGILAFRDYLIYAGNRQPRLRRPLGRLRLNSRGYPVSHIINTQYLEREGLVPPTRFHSFHDVAASIEKTLCRWRETPYAARWIAEGGVEYKTDAYGHALNLGVSVFWLAPRRNADPGDGKSRE